MLKSLQRRALECVLSIVSTRPLETFRDAHTSIRTQAKSEWLHALRGQIIVVYFYATVWKLHPDWLDGSIISGILLSFEQSTSHMRLWIT